MVCSCCLQPGHNINRCRDQSATTAFEALSIVPISELVEAIASMSSVHVAFAIAQTRIVQGTASTRRARLEAEMRRRALLEAEIMHDPVAIVNNPAVIQLMPTHPLYAILTQSLQHLIEYTRITVSRFGEHLARHIIGHVDRRYNNIQIANATLRELVQNNTRFITDAINELLLNSRVVYSEIIADRIFHLVVDYITARANAPVFVAPRHHAPIHRKLHIEVSCAPKQSLTTTEVEVLCGVCQDDLTLDTRITAGCGHTFCVACIEGTAKARGEKSFIRCPICRADVVELKMGHTKNLAALKSLLKKL